MTKFGDFNWPLRALAASLSATTHIMQAVKNTLAENLGKFQKLA